MRLIISETPVVGSPERFCNWFNCIDSPLSTIQICFRSYKNNLFTPKSGTLDHLRFSDALSQTCAAANEASHIYLHNVNDPRILNALVGQLSNKQKIYYHYHSPPNENPLGDFSAVADYSYEKIYCPAQGYSRFIKGSIPIMNIIPDLKDLPSDNKKAKILSCHLRTTLDRWSKKYDKVVAEKIKLELESIVNLKFKIEYMKPGLPHSKYLQEISKYSFIFDDIFTGLVHQQFFEALKVKTLPISAMDNFTLWDIATGLETKEAPPMININNISDSLRGCEADKSLPDCDAIKYITDNAERYARKYLHEERIARISIKKLLHNESLG